MPPFALLGVLLAEVTAVPPAAPVAPSVMPSPAPEPVPPLPPPTWRPRRFGLHLGLNATLAFDVSVGRFLYGGFATQLTGLGFVANQSRNFVLSGMLFGGVGLPLIEREDLRFTADITPAFTYLHAAPVNMVTVGLLAGVRVQHRSGFTFAVKLPLVGYAGAPDAQRGSLYYYYIASIVTVPAITFGYSF